MADKKAAPAPEPVPAVEPKPEPAPQAAPLTMSAAVKHVGELWLWAPDHPKGLHLGLTNGRTFHIPNHPDGIAVPKEFRREAIAQGAQPLGQTAEVLEPNTFDRAAVITAKMEQMLNSADAEPGYFDNDGRPSLAKLISLCGFNVDRSERDRLWKIVESGLED